MEKLNALEKNIVDKIASELNFMPVKGDLMQPAPAIYASVQAGRI